MSSAGYGWPSAPARITTGGCGEVACLLDGADDDRGRAVGLEAAVVEAERLRHPTRLEVVVHRERRAAHERLVVELRVRAERRPRSRRCRCRACRTAACGASRSTRRTARPSVRRTAGRSRAARRRPRRRRARGAGAARPRAAGTRSSRSSRRRRARCRRCPARPRAPRAATTRSGSRHPCARWSRAAASSMPRLAASSSLVV